MIFVDDYGALRYPYLPILIWPHRLAWSGRLLLRQKTPVQIRLGLPAITTLVKVSQLFRWIPIYLIENRILFLVNKVHIKVLLISHMNGML